MRWIVICVLLICGVAGFWFAAEKNQAVVVLLMPPHRLELSANLAIIVLLIGFVFFYALLRIVGLLINIPNEIRKRRAERSLQKFNKIFSQSISYFLQELYEKSFLELRKIIKLGFDKELLLAFAALLAEKTKNRKLREQFRKELKGHLSGGVGVGRYLDAKFESNDGNHQKVIDILSSDGVLKNRGSNVLNLIFEAQMSLANYEQATDILDILEKRGDSDFRLVQDQSARLLVIQKELDALKDNPVEIKKYWSKLKKTEKASESIVSLVLGILNHQKEHLFAKRIIEKSLDFSWNENVLSFYSDSCCSDLKSGLEKAESWLEKRPNDPHLLRVLGGLCIDNRIWGKANSYLSSSLDFKKTPEAFWEMARLYEATNRADEAVQCYRNGLALSLKVQRKISVI